MASSPDSDLRSHIESLAELSRQKAKSVFGVDLDYSADSITRLDDMIQKGWPQPPVFLDTMVEGFGSYLGEVIRRLHGGEWRHTEADGYFLDRVGGRDMQIYPMARVRKRFLKGKDECLEFYYSALKNVVLKSDASASSAAAATESAPPVHGRSGWWRRLFRWIIGR
jgi:Family of unknown function (DUF6278)